MGGKTVTYSVQYDDLDACLQPARGRIVEQFAKRSMLVDYVAYTPVAIDLREGDRVVNGGDYYTVVAWGDMAGRGTAFAIYLKKKDQ